MKILPRTQFGDPILRKKARRVPKEFLETKEFELLVRQMFYTMHRAQGVGLAAPQIGRNLSLAVVQVKPGPSRPELKKGRKIVMVNPQIIKYSEKQELDWEGCLSLKGVRGQVPRSKSVKVHYWNERGEVVTEEVSGILARIYQHEIDHLNGILYVDCMPNMKSLMTLSEFKKRIVQNK